MGTVRSKSCGNERRRRRQLAGKRKEEDGGGGVGWTVYPTTVIYSTSGNLRQISAVHDEVETTELI
jgi:hypothetical protein